MRLFCWVAERWALMYFGAAAYAFGMSFAGHRPPVGGWWMLAVGFACLLLSQAAKAAEEPRP